MACQKVVENYLYDEPGIVTLLNSAGFVKSEFKKLSFGWASSIIVIEAKC